MKKEVILEMNELKCWAEDVKNRLRGKVDFQIADTYHIDKYNVFICCFDIVNPEIPSKKIKDIIRQEADKYKNGRLYFMAYNDIQKVMILLFYSFYLDRENEPSIDQDIKITSL